MSAKVMGKVWDLDLPHNKLIVLLAMADHADHDGNNVFPSLGLIAWKTGYSEQQVRRVQRLLVDEGILKVVDKTPGHAIKYQIDMTMGTVKAPYTPSKMSGITKSNPLQSEQGKALQNVTPPPDMPSAKIDAEPSVQPSLEPSINTSAGRPASVFNRGESVVDRVLKAQKDIPTEELLRISKDSEKANQQANPGIAEPLKKQTKEERERTPAENIGLTSLIQAWLDASKVVSPSAMANKTIRREAVILFRLGITPEDIKEFIAFKQTQKFWQDNPVMWRHVTAGIQGFRDKKQRSILVPKFMPGDEPTASTLPTPGEPVGLAAGVDPELVKQMIRDVANKFSANESGAPSREPA